MKRIPGRKQTLLGSRPLSHSLPRIARRSFAPRPAFRFGLRLAALALALCAPVGAALAQGDWRPQLANAGDNAKSRPVEILHLAASGADSQEIDYAALPTIPGRLSVVSAAAPSQAARGKAKIDMHHLRFRLHNYLIHHDDLFWCIWSDGPPIEDEPTQEVRYSTSVDGAAWSEPKSVTGTPRAPYAFIARGLWLRNGELLALAAHFKGKGAFGADKELTLQAYRWEEPSGAWRSPQIVYDNAINNFPPQKLPGGEWILTRRNARFNVSVLIGGRKSLNDWRAFPVVGVGEVSGFRPDEPIFWPLPDNHTLFALFRDNGGSQRLFHATSSDLGRTWSKPAITNFPNASSKLFSMQTSRGYRVLVLNANPKVGRRRLHLAVSEDGRAFTRLALLDIPSPPENEAISSVSLKKKFQHGIASLQYPHVIEHAGHLLIAFSRGKKQIEVFRVALDSVDALLKK